MQEKVINKMQTVIESHLKSSAESQRNNQQNNLMNSLSESLLGNQVNSIFYLKINFILFLTIIN